MKKKQRKNEIVGLLLLVSTLIAYYCLLFPATAGAFGPWLRNILTTVFGQGAYLFLLFFGVWSVRILLVRYPERVKSKLFGQILLIFAFSLFLSNVFFSQNFGGYIGKILSGILLDLFGKTVTILLTFTFFLLSLNLGTKFSLIGFISEVITSLKEKIITDWQEWQQERKRTIREKKLVPPIKPPVVTPVETSKDIPPVKPAVISSPQEKEEVEPLPLEKTAKKHMPVVEKKEQEYIFPSLDLLNEPEIMEANLREEDLREKAKLLEKTLNDFNIDAKIIEINPGPTITRYDLQPAPGVKIQSIVNLSDDIALAMQASSVRVLAPVPDKAAVGIEIPNPKISIVALKEIIASEEFRKADSKLTFALGKTTAGEPYITDLAPMPHLLIAGATGSGKSVCIHSIITSIIYKATPEEVKFLLIDPKRLELPIYDDIPHLYDPGKPAEEVAVITNPKEAAKSLEKLVKVMEHRYEKFAQATVRNIESYNQLMEKEKKTKEFYIVVIIDELADLMLIAPREVEDGIMRLAQMARAVGIHLILATQRPSVDVITGVIKANLPARIAFQVLSKVDSRVILDTQGAEDLLGKGDMLFLPTGASRPIRLHGAYVSEKEVERVVQFIKKQLPPAYEDIFAQTKELGKEEDSEMKELINYALG
ncbi:MAG TPA: cell division protein FtsK, partial [Elusimicrobia bacterium]|nr:cell division protein FtsK [Elusimicrobiota bacterium]